MDPSAAFEQSHVHTVYDEIASDFSRTRHSRWPFVEKFLESLPAGSVVLDAGTGNGKYLGVRSIVQPAAQEEPLLLSGLFNIGFDMSTGLLEIANAKGHEVVRGDCVDLSCWRRGAFDHAISIATIHHLATSQRRTESIKQMMLSVLAPESTRSRPPGRILIVVWSVEQDPALLGARSARRTTGGKKGAIEIDVDPLLAQQRRDQGRERIHNHNDDDEDDDDDDDDEAHRSKEGKDVFVPWEKQDEVVPRKKKEPTPRRTGPKSKSSDHRRRPLPPPPQLHVNDDDDDVVRLDEHGDGDVDDDGRVVDGDRESSARDPPRNTPAARPPRPQPPPVTAPAPTPTSPTAVVSSSTKPTFNRYYHLFARYELSRLVRTAARSLGLKFEYPSDYPLDDAGVPDKTTTTTLRDREDEDASTKGWERFARLVGERWERENWVAEIEVGWRNKARDSAAVEDPIAAV